jgi:hypothetical protein
MILAAIGHQNYYKCPVNSTYNKRNKKCNSRKCTKENVIHQSLDIVEVHNFFSQGSMNLMSAFGI